MAVVAMIVISWDSNLFAFRILTIYNNPKRKEDCIV